MADCQNGAGPQSCDWVMEEPFALEMKANLRVRNTLLCLFAELAACASPHGSTSGGHQRRSVSPGPGLSSWGCWKPKGLVFPVTTLTGRDSTNRRAAAGRPSTARSPAHARERVSAPFLPPPGARAPCSRPAPPRPAAAPPAGWLLPSSSGAGKAPQPAPLPAPSPGLSLSLSLPVGWKSPVILLPGSKRRPESVQNAGHVRAG